jgi:hypothetical protein
MNLGFVVGGAIFAFSIYWWGWTVVTQFLLLGAYAGYSVIMLVADIKFRKFLKMLRITAEYSTWIFNV